MPSRSSRVELDLTLRFDRSLLRDETLVELQSVLLEYAPKWLGGLTVWYTPRRKRPVDPSAANSLSVAVREEIIQHGPLYYQLMRASPDVAPRVSGTVEFHGGDGTLTLVVTVDEQVFARAGEIWRWGNTISLGTSSSQVNGVPAVGWVRQVFEGLCNRLAPAHGTTNTHEEFDTKNMSRAGGGLRAIGVDVSRHLSGLYWLNFFGPVYAELIGRDRLRTAPAHIARTLDAGTLLMLHPDPTAWNTPDYERTEHAVLRHLGEQFFFSRHDPERQTVGLSPRPPGERR
jgi:hypothetical protein